MDELSRQALFALRQHQMIKSGDTVIVACSGGADSVALFHFLFAQAQQLHITLRVAHVNHGMRGAASNADEAFVTELCTRFGVPLEVKRLRPPAQAGETWARQQRYAFFDALAAVHRAKVATAHTQNDNAETVLLHLARGAGVHGAAGIPAVRGCYIRPFLYTTRSQVEQYLQALGQPYVTDATNDTDLYARNRVRHTVLPALQTVHPGAADALARFAADMAQTAAYLDEQAQCLLEQAAVEVPFAVPGEQPMYRAHTLAAAPAPVCHAALRLLVLPWADPTSTILCLAQKAVAGGKGAVQLGTEAVFQVAQGRVQVQRPGLLAAPFAPAQWCIPFAPGTVHLPQGSVLTVWTQSYEEFIKFEKTPRTPLKFTADYDKISVNAGFRTRRPQDTFAPAGRRVTKPLKKLLSEEKLSLAARAALPVLAHGSIVLWAAGWGFAQSVMPCQTTRTLVHITVQTEETNHDA